MDIGDLLAPKGVVLRGGASSKRQALHALSEAASHALGVDEAKVFDALMEREALGSTGLGSGVAVPHARLAQIDKVTAVFVRLDTPVAFGAVDDRPVDLIFGLFAPPWRMSWSPFRSTDRGGRRPQAAVAALSLKNSARTASVVWA